MRRSFVALVVVAAVCSAGCVFHRVQVQRVVPQEAVVVTSPVKAHLKDGATVVYANGVTVSGGQLRGSGVRYDLALKQGTTVSSIPLESVAGMESFRTQVDAVPTVIVNSLLGAGAFVAAVALFKAIFGSCPTVYSGDGSVDEGELFSNSIAAPLEARDLDRLRARPDAKGTVRLEVRNEAMETHYINQLQLLAVEHDADEFALPDAQGRAVVVSGLRTPAAMMDRSGRDVRAVLGAADDRSYSTERRRIDGATAEDLNDWIDLTAAVPEGADAATLVFRMRNSLLSTTLLYDVVLAPAGARSIDWLGSGLAKMSTAVELGRWYQRRAGMHVLVWRDGEYREVVRVPDSGPIAWHDVAAVIPAHKGERELRIRLSFLADHWRIDRVGVAEAGRAAVARVVPISAVTGSGGGADEVARESLRGADGKYLQTNPGQRFVADFEVGGETAGRARTFLLGSQGYYTEWIRGSWIQSATAKEAFSPNDDAVLVALRKWSATRDEFEGRFMKNRVPVR